MIFMRKGPVLASLNRIMLENRLAEIEETMQDLKELSK